MRVGLVVLLRLLLLVSQLPFGWGLGAAELPCWAAQSTAPPMSPDAKPVIVIQAYNDGLAGVCVGNPDIHLSLGRDPSVSEEHVLLVESPYLPRTRRAVTYSALQSTKIGPAGARLSFRSSPPTR